MHRLQVVGSPPATAAVTQPSTRTACGAFPAGRAAASTWALLLFLGISGPKAQGAEDAEAGWDPSSPFPPASQAGRAWALPAELASPLIRSQRGSAVRSVGSQVSGLLAPGFLPWSTYVP